MRPLGRLAAVALSFAVLGLLGILLSVAPAGVGPDSLPSPAFLVLIVFIWLTQAPDAAPLVLILALALCGDALAGVELGSGALPLLGMVMLIRAPAARARRAGLVPRLLLLMVFAGGIALGQWALVGLARLSTPDLGAVVVQYVMTLAVYPFLSAFFRRVLRLGL